MSQADRTERLLNLLFALMASTRPVPKHVLRETIDAYRTSPSDEAFERMFERDKEELRSMGVPVLTVEGSDGLGGIEGYRVAVDEYALPPVELTPDELAVLSLAGRVWERASLGPAAQRAVLKLEALGGGGAVVDGPVGVETRIGTAEPQFPVLLEAVRTRRTVAFDYRKPGGGPEAREVQPWGVASRRGHWYLVGHDTGRDAPRVFRLSRIVGAVRVDARAAAYDVPADVDVVAMIAAAVRDTGDTVARVRVAPGRGNALRRRAVDPTAEVLEVGYADDETFAADLVALGPDAVVLEPPSLRDAVVRRLRLLAGEVPA